MKISDEYLPVEGSGRKELEIFYSWSIEDAWKAHEEWTKTEHQPIERGPFFRWDAAQELIRLAEEFRKTGDNGIILHACGICALNDLSMPRWCSMKYLELVRDVWHYKAKSWDASFGKPHARGTQLGAKQNKREKAPGVWLRIKGIKTEDPDIPIDRALFEAVGKEFGICGSLADEYYYYMEKRQKNPLRTSIKWCLDQNKAKE